MSAAGSESDDQDIESDGDELLESTEELVDDSEDSSVEESNEEDLQEEDQKSAEVLEIANLKDQLLRSTAEFENLKRRTVRDVENAHKFGTEKLISDLFPVIDSLEKAIETAQDVEGAEAIAEGVELSLKLFMDSLSRNGLSTVDPLGMPFDPSLHEALAVVPNENAEPNSVMEVIQKGFTLNERLVRAAKVLVVKEEKS
jgi:molecular chaperone GrpE